MNLFKIYKNYACKHLTFQAKLKDYTKDRFFGIVVTDLNSRVKLPMVSKNNKKTVPAGDVILRQGEKGDAAYIIESGLVEILIEKEKGLIQSLGTRGTGTIIGEMAMIDNHPRTATIKALEECELLEITRTDFEKRLNNADPVLKMIMQVILARYRDMMARAQILGKSDNVSLLEDRERGMVAQADAVKNIKLTNDLKDALKNNDLKLYYQPILDLKTGKLAGFEALMRWIHPEKGFIPPDVFIPVAEESGLIIDLSRWAALEACQALKRITANTTSKELLFVSVNFSAADFVTDGFEAYLSGILKTENLTPSQLHIEITERLLMEHPDMARTTLKACSEAGMVISIDDFGTGYSSLSYLHYFPIDILKIDRSFINNMKEDGIALELVKSIIALGHNMNMSIIAEGIEEEDQAITLMDMSCDKVQGYHFARPMPENDVISYILENKEKS